MPGGYTIMNYKSVDGKQPRQQTGRLKDEDAQRIQASSNDYFLANQEKFGNHWLGKNEKTQLKEYKRQCEVYQKQQKELEALKEKLAKLQQEKQTRINSGLQFNNPQLARHNEIASELQVERDKHPRLRDELTKIRQKYECLHNNNKKFSGLVSEKEKIIEGLESEIISQKQKVKDARNHLNYLTAEIQELAKQEHIIASPVSSELPAKYTELQNSFQQLSAECNILKQKLQATPDANVKETLAILNNQANDLNQLFHKAKKELKKLHDENQRLKNLPMQKPGGTTVKLAHYDLTLEKGVDIPENKQVELILFEGITYVGNVTKNSASGDKNIVLQDGKITISFDPRINQEHFTDHSVVKFGAATESPLTANLPTNEARKTPSITFGVAQLAETLPRISQYINQKATFSDAVKDFIQLVNDEYNEIQTLVNKPDKPLKTETNEVAVLLGMVALQFSVNDGALIDKHGTVRLTMICECKQLETNSPVESYSYIVRKIESVRW
jgi:uncharacterized coiled-coil protein SlyX